MEKRELLGWLGRPVSGSCSDRLGGCEWTAGGAASCGPVNAKPPRMLKAARTIVEVSGYEAASPPEISSGHLSDPGAGALL
jgi:hypothetical protein